MMPFIKELKELDDANGELIDEWGVDGTPLAADVFVDPYVAPGGSADCGERVWRTLLFSNFRSGGNPEHASPGIFALDVTQPDVITEATNTPAPDSGSLEYVPSCASGSATGCDQFCRTQGGQVDTDCAELRYPASSGVPRPERRGRRLRRRARRERRRRKPPARPLRDLEPSVHRPALGLRGRLRPRRPRRPHRDARGSLRRDLRRRRRGAAQRLDRRDRQLPLHGRRRDRQGRSTSAAEPARRTNSPISGAVPVRHHGRRLRHRRLRRPLYFGTTAGSSTRSSSATDRSTSTASNVIKDPPATPASTIRSRSSPPAAGRSITRSRRSSCRRYAPTRCLRHRRPGRSLGEDGQEARFYAILDDNFVDANRDGVLDDTCGVLAPQTERRIQDRPPGSFTGDPTGRTTSTARPGRDPAGLVLHRSARTRR